MTIRQRIMLLIALVFAALAVVGGFAVSQARQSAARVKMVTEGVVPSALQSAILLTQLKDVQIAALDMVGAPDVATVEQTRAALTARKAELQSALDAQLKTSDSKAQAGLIKEARESLENYFSSIDDTARFMLAGNKALADANMGANVEQYLREQGEILRTLQVEKNRSKDEAIAALNGDIDRTQATLSIVTIGAVLGLCLVGAMLYRQIVRPVGEMERKMTEIATSQDFTLRVPVTRADEIGKSMMAFNAMVEKIQQSTQLVRQKTADIHSMMQAIPQGILTLEAGGRIHSEYSDYLREILETTDIAGRDVMTVLFAGAALGDDARSSLEATIGACIGEDEMNFEFNAHLLPRQIEKTFDAGTVKILDLNWSPMTDGGGTISRLLVCVRDVTELRELARVADAGRRELAIIGEILGVTHEKFHEFIEGSLGFFDQNVALVATASKAADGARAEAVHLLLRNMHTIKGNARTHGLVHVTDVLHRIEESYDALRKGEAPWDGVRLAAELVEGRQVLEEYVHLNEAKLGRHGPGRRGAVDRFVMVPKEQLQRLLGRLDGVDSDDPAAIAGALAEMRQAIRLAGTERMSDVLSGVIDSLPSLARELGKSAPDVTVEDHGVLVRSQIAGTLRNAFMHLCRNAIDHGIETAEARVALGKSPIGTLKLDVTLDSRHLRMVLRDDGRGLALAQLRAKAIGSGLISESEGMNAADVANLIFAPGFSTARSVTQVSGRGVGMDAVRGFIEGEGGEIAIELSETAASDEFTPFRIVLVMPAKFGVATLVRANPVAIA
jgi:two-component system chemotaxis sensor kinase CheA